MLYANKTVGNTSYKLSKKSMKEQTLLQKNKDLLIEIATRDVKSVFAYFKTTRDGLSMKEAQKRIQVYGRNELTSKRARIAEVMMKLSEMIPGFSKQHVLTGKDASIEKFESCYHLERKRFIPLKRMKDYNPLELENVCFKGTYIVGGNAKAVVVSTGKNTYSGILHTCCSRTS